MRRKLTGMEAETIKTPGLHRADETLYLYVAPGGSKSWVQRLTVHGRRRDIGLGGFPIVSLAEARELAFNNRKLARAGGDPLAERRKAKMPTFREAAVQTFEANRPRWRNGKRIYNWMQGMEKYVFPLIGEMRVDQLGREDVLRILKPLWSTRPGSARKHLVDEPDVTRLSQ